MSILWKDVERCLHHVYHFYVLRLQILKCTVLIFVTIAQIVQLMNTMPYTAQMAEVLAKKKLTFFLYFIVILT